MLTLLSVEVTRFVSIGSRFVTKEREGCCFCCEIEEEERGEGLLSVIIHLKLPIEFSMENI